MVGRGEAYSGALAVIFPLLAMELSGSWNFRAVGLAMIPCFFSDEEGWD